MQNNIERSLDALEKCVQRAREKDLRDLAATMDFHIGCIRAELAAGLAGKTTPPHATIEN